MTEKLYEQDAFLIKFEAQVLSCEKGKKGFDIVLDRTAFYRPPRATPRRAISASPRVISRALVLSP